MASTSNLASTGQWSEPLTWSRTAAKLNELFAHLTEREKGIVRSRRGLGTDERTLEQLARIHGISIERVRQIERTAIKRLKQMARPPQKNNPNAARRRQKPPNM